jgi:hypothetical protein
MQETHCPICFGELEARELAPCDDCGGDPEELIHFREGRHKYAVFESSLDWNSRSAIIAALILDRTIQNFSACQNNRG